VLRMSHSYPISNEAAMGSSAGERYSRLHSPMTLDSTLYRNETRWKADRFSRYIEAREDVDTFESNLVGPLMHGAPCIRAVS
jgi:hypothetical protein